MNVTRIDAETWSSWFRALGDPSRIVILNVLATTNRAMTVGEIVDAVDIGQSTVSHHLKTLAETGFVHLTQAGTRSLYEMNRACLERFPTAAETVMGRASVVAPWKGDHQ
jgi:DNA-binding transcriptional ArsR family regulator